MAKLGQIRSGHACILDYENIVVELYYTVIQPFLQRLFSLQSSAFRLGELH